MKIRTLLNLSTLLALSSCSKDPKNTATDQSLLGTWKYNNYNIVINNTDGIPAPYAVTLISDSLIIQYPPSINLRYKLLLVDGSKMVVTSNDSLFVYQKQ